MAATNDAPAPEAHEEQMQQQPAARARVLRHHQTSMIPVVTVVWRVYTTALDEDGDLWERWSDDPEGEWSRIRGPVG